MDKLSQQLDDIANEASFWNDSDDQGSTHDDANSRQETTIVNDEEAPDQVQTSEANTETVGIIRKMLRYFWETADPEVEPLLPVHSPPQSPLHSPLIPEANPQAGAWYFILEFIWQYVLTESNRNFLLNHSWLFLLISLVIMVIILASTGNLASLSAYAKNILCYIIASMNGDNTECFQT
ncbi:Piso0_004363 [Millerozyma farinosa CBS 7064]|uniref:Piso0_004363 protein n=1 Tax=Pichia sorbitophila (strain ATCC MYA-4447 / BCRC 22081 / CBS 7064 / NBRC 10061 / NRRL Y-12695) TaxID=559304 RepID=G8Y596_PICSO|nr:Piso0_004363 [Millerozyma farinosa CBS 7064]CCE84807.1 Piso0_004363 [Millerozyma farinosa CBS 7064]